MPQPWYDWVTWDPQTRLVVNFDTERGDVTRFIVAFDYKLGGSWERVPQFGHNPEASTGHDIEQEGLHMAFLREGQK